MNKTGAHRLLARPAFIVQAVAELAQLGRGHAAWFITRLAKDGV